MKKFTSSQDLRQRRISLWLKTLNNVGGFEETSDRYATSRASASGNISDRR